MCVRVRQRERERAGEKPSRTSLYIFLVFVRSFLPKTSMWFRGGRRVTSYRYLLAVKRATHGTVQTFSQGEPFAEGVTLGASFETSRAPEARPGRVKQPSTVLRFIFVRSCCPPRILSIITDRFPFVSFPRRKRSRKRRTRHFRSTRRTFVPFVIHSTLVRDSVHVCETERETLRE